MPSQLVHEIVTIQNTIKNMIQEQLYYLYIRKRVSQYSFTIIFFLFLILFCFYVQLKEFDLDTVTNIIHFFSVCGSVENDRFAYILKVIFYYFLHGEDSPMSSHPFVHSIFHEKQVKNSNKSQNKLEMMIQHSISLNYL